VSGEARSRLESSVNRILGTVRNSVLNVTESLSGLRLVLEALDALLENVLKDAAPSSYEESRDAMNVFFHAVEVMVSYLGSVLTLADIVGEAYRRVESGGGHSKWVYPSIAKQVSLHLRELHEIMYRSLRSRCPEAFEGSNLVITAIGSSEELLSCLSSIEDRVYEVVVPIDEVMKDGLRLKKRMKKLSPRLYKKTRLTVDATTLYMVRHSNYVVSSTTLIRPDGTAVVPSLSYLPLRTAERFGVKIVIPTYSWNFLRENRVLGPLPKRRHVVGEGLKDVYVPLFEAARLGEEVVLVTEEEVFRWGTRDIAFLAGEFRRRVVESVLRVGYKTA